MILNNKKYDLTGWISDETQADSVFREVILKLYSEKLYNQIVRPTYKYSFAKELDSSDYVPDCYIGKNKSSKKEIAYVAYGVRGDFLIISKLENKMRDRYKAYNFCPIKQNIVKYPFCIMTECDSVYRVSNYFLEKNNLIKFILNKNKINYCD